MRSARTLAAAVALAAAGLSIAAPSVAFAAPATAPAMPAAVAPTGNISLIDPNATVSLDIHKYLGDPTGAPNDGTALQTAPSLPPLQGVDFDVYRVEGVDLTTNAGWAAATDLQGKAITQLDVANGYVVGTSGTRYTITKVSTVTTGTTGTAVFTKDAGTGLYLVNENLSTSTAVTNTQTGAPVDKATITPATPFYVTLPMTDPNKLDNWMYTVNVYPKNQTNAITKTVADRQTTTSSMTNTGDPLVDYTLTGTITANTWDATKNASTLGTYVIADKLPTGEQYYGVPSVTISGTTTKLVAGTDYDVYVNGVVATGPVAADAPQVQIVLKQPGLDAISKAKAANTSASVVVDLQVKTTIATGDLANTAQLVPSTAWWQSATNDPQATYDPKTDTPVADNGTPVTTTIVSPKVDTRIGQAKVTKTDGANAATTLDGAVFSLYSAVISTSATTATTDMCSTVVNGGTPIMTGLTTANGGVVSITGLQESDFWDNTQQASQRIVYCLVETKAPTGYNLNAQPTAFFVNDYTATAAVQVQDEKSNLANNLPLTGGAGASILGLGGLAVVGGTLATRAIAKKRDEDEENELV